MKRLFVLIASGMTLYGCYSNGCLHLPQSVSCFGDMADLPLIAKYQKPNTIGHTDAEQRWKDAEACGVKRIGDDGMDFEYDGDFVTKFNNLCDCMESKGYIYLGSKCSKMKDQNRCNLK